MSIEKVYKYAIIPETNSTKKVNKTIIADPSVLYECPLRVFAPLRRSSPVSVCDYLFQDEGAHECVDRLAEVLDMTDLREEDLDTKTETLPGESKF